MKEWILPFLEKTLGSISRTSIVAFHEDCVAQLGTSRRFMGPGDIVAFMGPFGLAAVALLLLALIFTLISAKKKGAAAFGGIFSLGAIGAAALFVSVWIVESHGYFFSGASRYGLYAAGGLGLVAFILLIICIARAGGFGKTVLILLLLVCMAAGGLTTWYYLLPNLAYVEARNELDSSNYTGAIEALEKMNGFRDAEKLIEEAKEGRFRQALEDIENARYDEAIAALRDLGDYRDAAERVNEALEGKYQLALAYMESGEYRTAVNLLSGMTDYRDASDRLAEAQEKLEQQQAAARAAEQRKKEQAQAERDRQTVRTVTTIYAADNGLAEYKSGDSYGVINTDGRIILPAKYESVEILDYGYIAAGTSGNYGLFNPDGTALFPAQFETVYDAGLEGYWCVKKSGSILLINRRGETLAACEYFTSFSEGLARVFRPNGGVVYIDSEGKTVISLPNATSATAFENGTAHVIVTENGAQKYQKINQAGEVLSSVDWKESYKYPQYDAETDAYIAQIGSYNGTLVSVSARTGEVRESWSLDTANGARPTLHINGSVGKPSEGKIAVMMYEIEKIDAVLSRVTETMCYLDTGLLGLVIFPAGSDRWSEAGDFEDGYAIVRTCAVNQQAAYLGMLDHSREGKYGIIDAKGNYAVKPKYDSIRRLTGNYYKVKSNGKWSIIDVTTGQLASTVSADEIGSFSAGLCRIKNNGSYGYINTSLQVAIPAKYDAATSFDAVSRKAFVRSGTTWYEINTQGEVVW